MRMLPLAEKLACLASRIATNDTEIERVNQKVTRRLAVDRERGVGGATTQKFLRWHGRRSEDRETQAPAGLPVLRARSLHVAAVNLIVGREWFHPRGTLAKSGQ
jgi:hypothetical protein